MLAFARALSSAYLVAAVLQTSLVSAYTPRPGWRPSSYGHGSSSSLWSGWGGDAQNDRWAQHNSVVDSSTITTLSFKCKQVYADGVSATPTIGPDDIVYYPTWSGELVALDYSSCKVKWSINVTKLILDFAPTTAENANVDIAAVSRTSPQVSNGVIYFATLLNALVVAADTNDGCILDTVQLNPNQFAIVTQSPTFHAGKLFVGASSFEEVAAEALPDYQCCNFIGNMAAFTLTGGRFKTAWNISMIPDFQHDLGWSGAAIWGSQPAIDVQRKQVIIATGNTYSVPDVITQCQRETANITAIAKGLAPDACLPANIWQEAVLAIDIDIGLVNWIRQLTPLDSWTLACGIPGAIPKLPGVCPGVVGPDADFGMAPSFVPGGAGTPYGRDIVVIGQKNGNLYALNAQTGSIFWSTATSPDGTSGGLSWGVAADNERAYFTAINSLQTKWELVPSNISINNSAWGAASLKDGSIVWETAAPPEQAAYGPPTVVGDIVLVARAGTATPVSVDAASKGGLIALDKMTGRVIVDKTVDATFRGGGAVQDEYVLFGTGYSGTNHTGTFYVAKVGT